MSKSAIEFNEEKHEYTVKGAKVPSVTKILQATGVIKTSFYTEEGRERGTEIHKQTEYYDDFRIIADTNYKPYIEQWAKFLDDIGAKVLSKEEMVYSELGYCGKYDRVLEIKDRKFIIDIKTGAKQKWHVLQLGAYSIPTKTEYGAVVLLSPKKYDFIPFEPMEIKLAQFEFLEVLKRYKEIT